MNRWLLITLIVLGVTNSCLGQIETDPSTTAAVSDTITKDKNGILSMFSGNPGRAALYSLVLPGAGQAYNKKYWKVPIAIALDATMLGIVINYNSRFQGYDSAINRFRNGEITRYGNAFSASEAYQYSRLFQKRRDNFIIGLVIVHIVQVSDAFISRHLIEFDVSDDLSINFTSTQYGLGLALTF